MKSFKITVVNNHRISNQQQQRDDTAWLYRCNVMHFVTLWPWPLTFWPNIHWLARYCDGLSLCQVWRFWFKPFWFYRADRETDRNTDADDLPSASVTSAVSVMLVLVLVLVGLVLVLGLEGQVLVNITVQYILWQFCWSSEQVEHGLLEWRLPRIML